MFLQIKKASYLRNWLLRVEDGTRTHDLLNHNQYQLSFIVINMALFAVIKAFFILFDPSERR